MCKIQALWTLRETVPFLILFVPFAYFFCDMVFNLFCVLMDYYMYLFINDFLSPGQCYDNRPCEKRLYDHNKNACLCNIWIRF